VSNKTVTAKNAKTTMAGLLLFALSAFFVVNCF
jgi:hypothetical protein